MSDMPAWRLCVLCKKNIENTHKGRKFCSEKCSKSPEYKAWSSLKNRCLNPNNKKFHHYGGRGISVCKKWEKSFESFIKDMGVKPNKNYTLDRIDNNKGYSPKNCRWTSYKVNNNNRRPLKPRLTINYKGKDIDFNEAIIISGLKRRTLHNRIFNLGWSVEEAMETKTRNFTYKGWNKKTELPETQGGQG